MENQNLNVAPTEQELINAGFIRRTHDLFYNEDGFNYTYSKDIGNNLKICIHTEYATRNANIYTCNGNFLKNIDLTKAAINKEFEHFNQPLPQWEQPRPKVGEVWENKLHRFHIIKGLNGSIWALILAGKDKSKVFDLSMVKYNHTKLADSLEDYYFNKQK